MFLGILATKSCLDPTSHTWLRSASIDGSFDTHKGGFCQHWIFEFLTSLTVASILWRPAPWYGWVWRLGMMKMVFYRCQAIHISCPLQIAEIIAIWPHLVNSPYAYDKNYFKEEILSGETISILLFFTFENFSILGGNKTERLNLKEIFIFLRVER